LATPLAIIYYYNKQSSEIGGTPGVFQGTQGSRGIPVVNHCLEYEINTKKILEKYKHTHLREMGTVFFSITLMHKTLLTPFLLKIFMNKKRTAFGIPRLKLLCKNEQRERLSLL
jgi:hypothetical protein